MADLSKFVRHCLWANAAWIEFVGANLMADDYAVRRISHILLGERAWFQRIAGVDPDPEIWLALSLDALREVQAVHERTYNEYLRGDLERIVSFTRFTGERYASPVGDILTHLVTHGAHHRGQLVAHVATLGGVVPNTDFIQFCLTNGL